jgi:predicted transglutaminase-like cysteine proteinase
MSTAPRNSMGREGSVGGLLAAVLAGCLLGGYLVARAQAGEALDLPVAEVVERYAPYRDFCRRRPAQCELRGRRKVELTPALRDRLQAVNSAVNSEIRFTLDGEQYDREEYWALPTTGRGDCEDMALEKRARLAASGIASAALRLAFVQHRRFLSSHCVLTVETSAGTYVLDSFSDAVMRWDRVPYNFESRERVDGDWERFDQGQWRYDH